MGVFCLHLLYAISFASRPRMEDEFPFLVDNIYSAPPPCPIGGFPALCFRDSCSLFYDYYLSPMISYHDLIMTIVAAAPPCCLPLSFSRRTLLLLHPPLRSSYQNHASRVYYLRLARHIAHPTPGIIISINGHRSPLQRMYCKRSIYIIYSNAFRIDIRLY